VGECKVLKEPNFKLWTAALKSLDDEHVNNECRLCEMIAKDHLTRLEFRRNHTLANPSHNANVNHTTTNNNNSTNATTSSFTTAHLPALTTNERTLLAANEGCFKCQCLFVNHCSPQCDNDFPAAEGYKAITDADVTAAKARKTKKPVAAITPTTSATLTALPPVAVVMPNLASSVLGDDSDSEYILAPFHTPHFRWKCLLSGPHTASEVSVESLIDNSSHSVLISSETADQIGLTRRQLLVPEEVELAMAGGVKQTFAFNEWVMLNILSSDQTWSSRPVCAIVAPGLCIPLLLGGPFLSFNRLVMDHELRTCIDKSTGFDLLNPPPIV
jgi:hypothetical protein